MTPENIVKDFIAAWNRMDLAAAIDMLSEDILYHNIPLEPLHGKAAVRAYLMGIQGFSSIDWKLLNIAANGNIVLTERVDDFVLKGQPVSLPLMGVFEISGGKIRAWRDYFDLTSYRRQLGQG